MDRMGVGIEILVGGKEMERRPDRVWLVKLGPAEKQWDQKLAR